MRWTVQALAAAGLLVGAALPFQAESKPAAASVLTALRARPAAAEVVYFVLPDRFDNGDSANDRGGLTGDRLVTGFDPTDKAF